MSGNGKNISYANMALAVHWTREREISGTHKRDAIS